MNSIKLKDQKKIILDDFNFKKIELLMKTLNWQYENVNGERSIPNISELRKAAEFCIDQVIDNEDEDTFSMGGFEVIKVESLIELRFILEKSNILKLLK